MLRLAPVTAAAPARLTVCAGGCRHKARWSATPASSATRWSRTSSGCWPSCRSGPRPPAAARIATADADLARTSAVQRPEHRRGLPHAVHDIRCRPARGHGATAGGPAHCMRAAPPPPPPCDRPERVVCPPRSGCRLCTWYPAAVAGWRRSSVWRQQRSAGGAGEQRLSSKTATPATTATAATATAATAMRAQRVRAQGRVRRRRAAAERGEPQEFMGPVKRSEDGGWVHGHAARPAHRASSPGL